MKHATPPDDRHLPPTEKPPVSPWLLVLGTAFGCLSLAIVGLLALSLIGPPETPRFNEVRMKDGSILRIEGISYGRSHRLDVESSSAPAWAFWERRRHPLTHGTGQDQLMIWMSRHSATSGQSMNFDWWMSSEVVNANGQTIGDTNPMHWQFGRGSSSSSGHRPFRADRQFNQWVVGSYFRAFRTDNGRFQLQVKNISGEVVAKLDLSHPSPPQPQNWTAEELPATKSSGDIAVILERLQPHSSEHTTNGVRQRSWYFHPIAKVTEQGMGAKNWSTNLLRMTDPLGNECSGTDVAASISEPAWKVQLVAHRTEQSTFAEAETWKIADIELPAKNVAKPLTDTKTIDGVSVKLVAVAGAGKSSYLIPPPPGSSRHSSFSSSNGNWIFDSNVKMEIKGVGTTITSTIEANWPHLSLESTNLSPLHRLYVRATDDQGRDVPTHQSYHYNHVQSFFFKTEPDAKSVTLTVIVHKGYDFEFFVRPPELKDERRKQ